jgi:hypothetical protein
MVICLVKSLAADLSPSTSLLALDLIESTVFEAPKELRETAAHRQILLVEIPQLFIQHSLTVVLPVFERLFNLFLKFLGLNTEVLTSFPMIIDEMITPGIESGGESAARALQMLNSFNKDEPFLITVFAISDCASDNSRRVIECLFQAMSKATMDSFSDYQSLSACLSSLELMLSSFRRFYAIAGEDDTTNASQGRTVLEQKMTVEGCSKVFNKSPKRGIQSIVDSGLADNTPQSLASFIRNCPLLDQAKVSEYLAQPSQVELLGEYLNTFQFADMTLDGALRELCSVFRLPGESQQIDRVMQAFARKYHLDNSSITEDAAYVISFSIIMLHTDIHNPNVVKKITCEQWIANTRYVKEAQEVDAEFLAGIYQRVSAKKMKLHADGDRLRKQSRKQLKQLMARTLENSLPPVTKELFLLLVDRSWSILFAAVSLAVQGAAELSILSQALTCTEHLAYFLATYAMPLELNTVVSFLCVFCVSSPLQIPALRTVIAVAKENANALGDSWLQILELFSKVMKPRSPSLAFAPIDNSVPRSVSCETQGLPVAEIESIYAESSMLDRQPLLTFVKALCQVSTSEFFENPPSLFSLQKLIEVAQANINRVRFIWSLIWSQLSSHFCRAACLPHLEIASFGLRGLRGLCGEIARHEDKWQHFQQEIISPFLVTLQNQTIPGVRRCVLDCLAGFVTPAVAIDSGWQTLLELFEIAAYDSDRQIVLKAYQIIESNLATIPPFLNEKLVVVLLVYAIREKDAEIAKTAMAYVVSIADKIEPFTAELWTRISVVLTESRNAGVIQLASNLVFMLVPKLPMGWPEVESQMVLPLFATSNDQLEGILLNGLFHTLLPLVRAKALSVVTRVSMLLIDLNQADVLPLLTEEICALPRYDGEEFTAVCVRIASAIVKSAAADEKVVEIALDRANKYFEVVSECVVKALALRAMPLILKGLPMLVELGVQSGDNQVRTSEIVIQAIMFANRAKGPASRPLLPLICDLLDDNGYLFLRERRIEFQAALFEFFTNEAPELRALVKKIALASQCLFSS